MEEILRKENMNWKTRREGGGREVREEGGSEERKEGRREGEGEKERETMRDEG